VDPAHWELDVVLVLALPSLPLPDMMISIYDGNESGC
jgi:hypothetical protein